MADEHMVEKILVSVGVEKYDPLVVTALHEYVNRFAGDLLCDAKDLSTHASRSEIDVSDAKAAVAMSDTYVLGSDPRDKLAMSRQFKINSVGLGSSKVGGVFDEKIWTRVPGIGVKVLEPTKALLQRSYTLAPSSEVNPAESIETAAGGGGGSRGNNASETNSRETIEPIQMEVA